MISALSRNISPLWRIALIKILTRVRENRFGHKASNMIASAQACPSGSELRLRRIEYLFDFIYRNWSLVIRAANNRVSFMRFIDAIQPKIYRFREDGLDLHRYEDLLGFDRKSCKIPIGKGFCKVEAGPDHLCRKHRKESIQIKQQILSFIEISSLSETITGYLIL